MKRIKRCFCLLVCGLLFAVSCERSNPRNTYDGTTWANKSLKVYITFTDKEYSTYSVASNGTSEEHSYGEYTYEGNEITFTTCYSREGTVAGREAYLISATVSEDTLTLYGYEPAFNQYYHIDMIKQ